MDIDELQTTLGPLDHEEERRLKLLLAGLLRTLRVTDEAMAEAERRLRSGEPPEPPGDDGSGKAG